MFTLIVLDLFFETLVSQQQCPYLKYFFGISDIRSLYFPTVVIHTSFLAFSQSKTHIFTSHNKSNTIILLLGNNYYNKNTILFLPNKFFLLILFNCRNLCLDSELNYKDREISLHLCSYQ